MAQNQSEDRAGPVARERKVPSATTQYRLFRLPSSALVADLGRHFRDVVRGTTAHPLPVVAWQTGGVDRLAAGGIAGESAAAAVVQGVESQGAGRAEVVGHRHKPQFRIRRDQQRSRAIASMQKLVDEGLASGVSEETMDDILKTMRNTAA